MLAFRLEDPAPPSVDPLACAGARALAEEFETHAASLGATFSRFEQACLDIGARLGEAVPGLADLATMFDALSGALESGGIDKACEDLATTSADLTQAAGDLIEEGRSLVDLVDAEKRIGVYIDVLFDCIHTMSALMFMLKIEFGVDARTPRRDGRLHRPAARSCQKCASSAFGLSRHA